MYLAVLAAVTAAMNSASVELSAVSDCVFDLQAIAPPEKANAHPVVDLRFRKSFACAASTNPVDFPWAIGSGHCLPSGCMAAGGSDFDSSESMLLARRANFIPQCLVARRHLATFFGQVW